MITLRRAILFSLHSEPPTCFQYLTQYCLNGTPIPYLQVMKIQGQKVQDLADELFLDDVTTAMRTMATQPGNPLDAMSRLRCSVNS